MEVEAGLSQSIKFHTMTLELKIYSCLCATEVFNVNGIKADTDDFGSSYDESPEDAEDYGCGNRVFEAKHPDDDILKKYGINNDEYSEIAVRLTDSLSFGSCGWCV